MNTWTFLFTDIEGSTPLFERAPEPYRVALKRHFDLLQAAIAEHGGKAFRNTGDGLLAAFRESRRALECAVAAQRALSAAAWPPETGPLRVRMGVHRGEAEEDGDDFHGLVMHHASRVMSAAHGGQVLCSGAVRDDAGETSGVAARDLGLYRLRGAPAPVRLYQVESAHESPAAFPPPRTLAAFTHQLPARATKFFGRDAEIHELTHLLAPEPAGHVPRRYGRLVTLLGPGGTGKTRLSLAVAERLLNAYSGAVWFVELAELRDGALMAETLRESLAIPAEPGVAPLEQVGQMLAPQPSLLVLDNFEQLVPSGVETVRALLEKLPDLVCLVSSRVRLELTAEQDFSVAPLFLPPASGTPTELLRNPSVQLYCDRARTARRDFQLTPENAPAIAQLCRALEGMPLALELAAARAAMLTPAQMLARLEHRLDFLVGRKQDFAQRHRTLRAAVAWSYELLAEPLQHWFARLSIFRGGWTLEAAEAVAGAEGEPALAALDHLTELQGCSLIVAEERDAAMRYRMLEVIREFAQERLVESSAYDEVAARHRAYFLALAGEDSGLSESQQLAALEADCDNLRAVLAGGGPGLDRVTLAIDVYPFWMKRGHVQEGREWLRRLAPEAAETPRAASFANAAGVLAWDAGDFDEAQAHWRRALAISERDGREANVAGLLNNLGILANEQGHYAEAEACYERSLVIYRRLGLRSELGAALSNAGRNRLDSGRAEAARLALDEALEIQRSLPDEFFDFANTLDNLAEMELRLGNPTVARRHLAECLRRRVQLGTEHDAPAAFCTLAEIALAEQAPARAAALLAAARKAAEKCETAGRSSTAQRLARVAEKLAAFERGGSAPLTPLPRLESVLTEAGEWAFAVDQR